MTTPKEAIERLEVLDDCLTLEEAYPENPKANSMDLLCRDVNALIASHKALVEALDGMIQAYWRGSEDSSDAQAPECVKKALAALKFAGG